MQFLHSLSKQKAVINIVYAVTLLSCGPIYTAARPVKIDKHRRLTVNTPIHGIVNADVPRHIVR